MSWHISHNGIRYSGGDIQDVIIEDCTIVNCASAFQILGQEYALSEIPTRSPLSGFIARRNHIEVSKVLGRGILSVITGAPLDVEFDDNYIKLDGAQLIIYDAGTKLVAGTPNTQAPAGPMGTLKFTKNRAIPSTYGFSMQGNHNGANWQAGANLMVVTGNVFADANATLKKSFPDNVFLTRAEWDAQFG